MGTSMKKRWLAAIPDDGSIFGAFLSYMAGFVWVPYTVFKWI